MEDNAIENTKKVLENETKHTFWRASDSKHTGRIDLEKMSRKHDTT